MDAALEMTIWFGYVDQASGNFVRTHRISEEEIPHYQKTIAKTPIANGRQLAIAHLTQSPDGNPPSEGSEDDEPRILPLHPPDRFP